MRVNLEQKLLEWDKSSRRARPAGVVGLLNDKIADLTATFVSTPRPIPDDEDSARSGQLKA